MLQVDSDALVREMPNNVEVEQQILGAFLLDPDGTSVWMNQIKAESFYLQRHRTIFRAMRALADKAMSYDIISVANWLDERGEVDRAGGRLYLNELQNRSVTTAAIEHHIEILKVDATRRALIAEAAYLQEAAYDESVGMGDVRAAADKITLALIEGESRGITSTADVVDAVHKEVVDTLRTGTVGITTGFSGLDRYLRGLKPGYFILAGRPGEGKTCLALNMAWRQTNAIDKKLGRTASVGFVSLEMRLEDLNKRLLSMVLGRSCEYTPAGMTRDYWEREVARAGMEVALHPIYVDDRPDMTIEHVVSSAMEMRLKHKIDVLYVDYLQLLHAGGRHDSRNQELGLISNRIMVLRKQLGIPVIALSQLSRENVRGHGRRPDLQDLRDSGALEQDADGVIFTHDAKKHNADTDVPHELIVAKYRYGETGIVGMHWNKGAQRFGDIAPDDERGETRDYTESRERE